MYNRLWFIQMNIQNYDKLWYVVGEAPMWNPGSKSNMLAIYAYKFVHVFEHICMVRKQSTVNF